MLEVIATDFAKSRLSSGAVTAWIDSLLVRTTSPRRSESRGSAPRVLAVGEQLVGAQRAGGDDDAARRERRGGACAARRRGARCSIS